MLESQSSLSLTEKIITQVKSVLWGQDRAVELALCTLLSDGHLLIEDAPGVGKTTLARALAKTFNGIFARVQFTSDLLPSDIIGVSVWNLENKSFEYKQGPVFANLLLADEINRSSPKTQSALLEAMSEKQVTVDGVTRKLPQPFMVIATQNAQEHFGTYSLPESELDRFAMRIRLGYVNKELEKKIFSSKISSESLDSLEPVFGVEEVLALKKQVQNIKVEDSLLEYIADLVRSTRESSLISLGAGPRAGIFLFNIAKALAFIRGREYVMVDDIKHVAIPVLGHRIILENSNAESNSMVADKIVQNLVDAIEIPL